MKDKVPEFDLDFKNAEIYINSTEFHERIIEFIENNIKNNTNSIILCHFTRKDGIRYDAELPRIAYDKALSKSLEFFTNEENYEKCKIIKELKEQL